MKKVLFAVGLSGIGFVGLNAQTVQEKKPAQAPIAAHEGKHKGGREKEMLDKLKEIGATDAQIEQLKPIFKEEHTKMMELKKDASIPDEEKKAKMKAFHKEQEVKIKEILGEEKAKALKAANKKHEGGHEGHKED